MKSRAWSTAESATRTESVRMYVISPTGPSAPTSTPSYSCCAIRIVIAAEKPSCFAASCCSVLVRNGGGGIGRASCRGKGEISGVAGSFKKKKKKNKRSREQMRNKIKDARYMERQSVGIIRRDRVREASVYSMASHEGGRQCVSHSRRPRDV